MKKALWKDSFKQIRKSYKRFVSLLLMALLGVGFFAGIRASSPDMKKSIDAYLDKHHVYDIEVLSTLGITNEDIEALKQIDGVESVYGTYSEDVMVRFEDEEAVIKMLQADENINTPNVIEGRLPEKVNECMIDDQMATFKNVKIGDVIEIEEQLSETEEDSKEDKNFKESQLTVVGIAKSPLYISRDKGTTTLGSGKISYIMYVHKDNIESDVYTEAYIIAKNTKNLETISDDYDLAITHVKDGIETIKEERQTARYDELIEEANGKLDDAQKELDDEKAKAEKQIADAEQEIIDGKKEIADGEKDIQDAKKQLQDGKNTADVKFQEAEAQISAGETTLAENQIKLNDENAAFQTKKAEASQGIQEIDAGITIIDERLKGLQENRDLANYVISTIEKINNAIQQIEDYIQDLEIKKQDATLNADEIANLEKEIASYKATIEGYQIQKQELESYGITTEKKNQIEAGIVECNKQKESLEKQKQDIQNGLQEGEIQLSNAQNQIAEARNQIEVSKAKLAEEKNKTAQEFTKAEKEIADGEKNIQEARKTLADEEKELAEKKEEFQTSIADAEKKLIDAREKVNDIEHTKWYIWDRYQNAGFKSYAQDTDNVAKLGDVFPIVFFLIAILISLTTMTRMVEEERVQIGTLKALGYKNSQIMLKYIVYSLLATMIGGLIGVVIGMNFLPRIVISMYQMLYNVNEAVIEMNLYYAGLGIGIMIFCIVGATIYTASKELKGTPSELMRPKAPKPGKRVLLEKIPFIWKRLNFTQKVTVRNMFRYKKKFLMTVIGISGCTALILAGFGLKDSISKIMDYQFKDIYHYDMMIALKGTLTDEEIQNVEIEIENEENMKQCIPIYMSSDTATNGQVEEDVQLIVPDQAEALKQMIDLRDLQTGEILDLKDDEVILTDKLAQLLNLKVGDNITIKNAENQEYTLKIGGIVEHYISHYVYMTKALYTETFGKEISMNVLYAQYAQPLTEDQESVLAEKILQNAKTASITRTSSLIETMDETLSAMNTVVYVLIISAGILAFVVLYNLSNINISERIRELATIKVLGFYDKEVYDYVTREIVLLTIIGIVFGLLFGFVLNSFILGTCEIDILRFKRMILPQSYLYAIFITVIFTVIVNFTTYFSLKKVDMIESLKSVE